jgi:hypothetical protein
VLQILRARAFVRSPFRHRGFRATLHPHLIPQSARLLSLGQPDLASAPSWRAFVTHSWPISFPDPRPGGGRPQL